MDSKHGQHLILSAKVVVGVCCKAESSKQGLCVSVVDTWMPALDSWRVRLFGPAWTAAKYMLLTAHLLPCQTHIFWRAGRICSFPLAQSKRSTPLSAPCDSSMRHVVIGGGVAGVCCVEELCRLRPDDSVTLISSSTVLKVCSLTYAYHAVQPPTAFNRTCPCPAWHVLGGLQLRLYLVSVDLCCPGY